MFEEVIRLTRVRVYVRSVIDNVNRTIHTTTPRAFQNVEEVSDVVISISTVIVAETNKSNQKALYIITCILNSCIAELIN